MNAVELIAKRRDGIVHSEAEIRFLALGAATGAIPDYQLAAWLMAAFLRPLNPNETAFLTLAMAESGKRLDLSSLPRPTLDKHSTGGVGDKTTIVLLPLLAACGLTMIKMSGRGLGITGGTIDKLASIPGLRTDLDPVEFVEQARRIGVALSGQTQELAPADKALYGLRDVTATVGSLPLIVSSILSKKLAAGAQTVLLDVKCGSGGLMPCLNDARALAAALKDTGQRVGLSLKIVISDMDQPLGRTAGNALEVHEALLVLAGKEVGRFRDFCIALAAIALEAVGSSPSRTAGREAAVSAISSGRALEKAHEWIAAQSGDPQALDSDKWRRSNVIRSVNLDGAGGWVTRVDARSVGLSVLQLGGGRREKEDRIDPTVGVETLVNVGDKVRRGQEVFRVHASSREAADEAARGLSRAIEVSRARAAARPVLIEEV